MRPDRIRSLLVSTPLLTRVLLLSVILEFVAIRILSRVGSVPRSSLILNAYQAMLTVGSLALSLGSGLAILLALAFTYKMSRSTLRDRALAFLLLVMTLIVVATLIQSNSLVLSVTYSILAVVVTTYLIFHISLGGHRLLRRIFIVFTVIAVGSIFYYKLIPQLEYALGKNLSFLHPFEIFLAGEAATLIATIAIFFGYLAETNRPFVSKKALVWAGVITSGFIAFYATSSWLLAIIAMWTLGFTMFLPFPMYAAVLFLFFYTVTASWSRSERWIGMGLLLLFFAGRLAQLGYLSMLMTIGLALISFPEAFGFTRKP